MTDFVLIVDDDDGIRESLFTLLEDEGYDVAAAASGAAAFEVMRHRGRPCLILLDLMMPGMDGAEFRARQLADATLAAAPVLVITAAGRSATEVRADGFLPKPFKAATLLAAIETHRLREPP